MSIKANMPNISTNMKVTTKELRVPCAMNVSSYLNKVRSITYTNIDLMTT
ncbi:unknown [Prevotella sp. CAG:1185]|nr:unknown [Prevotella sp. CAG:1185]